MSNPETRAIINIDEIEILPWPRALQPQGEQAERFGAGMGRISHQICASKLGYNITVVPPGKRAFPLHNHRVNEEMFFILDGSGEARIGDQTHPIRKGDFIACPPGGPETAHQFINTGDSELRYLGVSTEETPEIAEYPDSGKFSVQGVFRGADGESEIIRTIGRKGESLDYWEGE
jgi:uncharacterized cupin superfamily protein